MELTELFVAIQLFEMLEQVLDFLFPHFSLVHTSAAAAAGAAAA